MLSYFSFIRSPRIKTIITAGATSLLVGILVSANWTPPSATPPTCPLSNPACNPPIHTGTQGQNKEGPLTLGAFGGPSGLLVLNGRVGIGNPTPGASLDVLGGQTRVDDLFTRGTRIEVGQLTAGSKNSYIDFRGDDTYTDYGLRLLRGSAGANAVSQIVHRGTGDFLLQAAEAASMKFKTANIDRVTITPAGKVGIGITNPSQILEIHRNDSLPFGGSSQLGLTRSGNAGEEALLVGVSNHPLGLIGYSGIMSTSNVNAPISGWNKESHISMRIGDHPNSYFDWNTGWATSPITNLMYLDKTGLGVGTTNPREKLHVIGNILASGSITPSDKRMKDNVQPLVGALAKIEQLRGVSFLWNELSESQGHKKDTKDIGVIAQEVEVVYPELVTTYGEQGYKAVDYSRLTVVLIEAVKELKAENEALKQRVEVLERK